MIDWEELFKEKATIKHGGKYSYHHVKYINAHEKVNVTCPIHGDFLISPNSHLNGKGCPKCNGGISLTTEEFIEKAKSIHGDKYDYSKVRYTNTNTKVCIICKKHGEFWQKPAKHLYGNGCPYCSNRIKYTTDSFIEACKKKYGEEFVDYSEVEYVNRNTNIKLICKKCGKEFFVNPHNHLKRGDGCPICKLSKLEKEVYTRLIKEKVRFDLHKWFSWLNNGKSHKSLDFYLPDYNIAIECQGLQHFKPIEYFGGAEYFERQKKNDLEKYELCKQQGINIMYYGKVKGSHDYKVYDDLNCLLHDILSH